MTRSAHRAAARTLATLAAVTASAVVAQGCENGARHPGEGLETGTLAAALAVSADAHDVSALDYRVVAAGAPCDAPALGQKTVSLEAEAMPGWLAEGGTGDHHRFGDAFFVLPPGDYTVCATPVQVDGTASAECGQARGTFTVVAESTTEGVIYSQCEGDPTGGLDVVTALNDPPRIDDLVYDPTKFIDTCERAEITVSASDPNGDALTYRFELVDGRPGDALEATDNVARFSSTRPGKHLVRIEVEDAVGGRTRLEIPVHVSEASLPAGAVCNPANHHAYLLTPAVGSARQARQAAAAAGGYLASITSAEEQAFLAARFNGRLWIGLSDEAQEGVFAWDSGEPVDYVHFCGGEPNDRLGVEDFVEFGLFAEKCWNDMRDAGDPFQPRQGIIEIELP
jgi:hypothetical protein